MITELPATTTVQTRGRRSQRVVGPRSSSATPIWHTPRLSRANVGGEVLFTSAPGTPTMLTG